MASKEQYYFNRFVEDKSDEYRSIDSSSDGNVLVSVTRACYCNIYRVSDNNVDKSASFLCADLYPLVVRYCHRNSYVSEDTILVGGMDKVISQFSIASLKCIKKFSGHTDTVSCIEPFKETFLSGSWDFSIIQWKWDGTPLKKFQYHSAGVFCICPIGDRFLSGSSDCTIVLWGEDFPERTFIAHTQPVRSILSLGVSKNFLSAGNDGKVIKWNYETGECIQQFKAHNHFIYNLTPIDLSDPCKPIFSTSGEENCIKVWRGEELIQNITIPFSSVWIIKCLPSANLVVCSSSKSLILFSKDETGVNCEHLSRFKELVEYSSKKTEELDIDKMQTIDEGTLIPGQKEGEIRVFREGTFPVVYIWDSKEGKWNFYGHVVQNPDQQEAESRPTYEGIEYDYVIDVDGENGQKLKLPYNNGQDPSVAAECFIAKNNLPPIYLDQISNFILKNIPSSASFSSYNKNQTPKNSALLSILPVNSFTVFNKTNVDGMFKALHNLIQQINPNDSLDSQNSMNALKRYVNSTIEGSSITFDSLEFPWALINDLYSNTEPENKLPVFDLTKQLTLLFPFYQKFFEDSQNPFYFTLFDLFSNIADPSVNPACRMVVTRIFVNAFVHPQAHTYLMSIMKDVIYMVTTMDSFWINKGCQIASSTIILNYSVLIMKNQNTLSFTVICELLETIISKVDSFFESLDEEAIFRIFVSVGNIISCSAFKFSSELKSSLQQMVSKFKNDQLTGANRIEPLIKELRQQFLKM